MDLKYIDAHCHLQFEEYDADRDELLERMKERGVGGVLVGCDFESSRKAVELAEEQAYLYAAVGQHPTIENEVFDISTYRLLADGPKTVAIGECGLDYFRNDANPETKERQKNLLNAQIVLATDLDLPLIIHCRPSKGTVDAYRDLIEILKAAKAKRPNLRGDIHFFVGGVEEMRELNALGFTVSFTAVITFARDYDEVIRATPLDMILAETDAPYVAPASRRGERNDPLAAEEVVAKIAEVRGEDLEEVRAALLANTKRIFEIA